MQLKTLFFAAVMLTGCGVAGEFLTVSGNFPRDLYGPGDSRAPGGVCNVGPCIWGHADSAVLPILFHPPTGHRVRILALRGDLTAWIKSLPGDPPTQPEAIAGVLLGFQTTSSGGAKECEYCASDNLLNLKLASWLNTTGKPIHLEGTYTITFVFEKQ
jgi:hypothetical protein